MNHNENPAQTLAEQLAHRIGELWDKAKESKGHQKVNFDRASFLSGTTIFLQCITALAGAVIAADDKFEFLGRWKIIIALSVTALPLIVVYIQIAVSKFSNRSDLDWERYLGFDSLRRLAEDERIGATAPDIKKLLGSIRSEVDRLQRLRAPDVQTKPKKREDDEKQGSRIPPNASES